MELRFQMGLDVGQDVSATPKRFVAYGTRERPEIEMTFHVAAEVLASRKRTLAHVTLERPEARVNAKVNLQVALVVERFRTGQASVGLDARFQHVYSRFDLNGRVHYFG